LLSTKQIEELRGENESEFENHSRKIEEINVKVTKLALVPKAAPPSKKKKVVEEESVTVKPCEIVVDATSPQAATPKVASVVTPGSVSAGIDVDKIVEMIDEKDRDLMARM